MKAIRDWAKTEGWTVSDRGRLPNNVVEAYDAAHSRRSRAFGLGRPIALRAQTLDRRRAAPCRRPSLGRAFARHHLGIRQRSRLSVLRTLFDVAGETSSACRSQTSLPATVSRWRTHTSTTSSERSSATCSRISARTRRPCWDHGRPAILPPISSSASTTPLAGPGLVLPGAWGRFAERRRTALTRLDFGGLVATFRSGPPPGFFRVGWVRRFPNLNEFFVHHEDVRRADGRGPREHGEAMDEALARCRSRTVVPGETAARRRSPAGVGGDP